MRSAQSGAENILRLVPASYVASSIIVSLAVTEDNVFLDQHPTNRCATGDAHPAYAERR
jgi:hypothetical protein